LRIADCGFSESRFAESWPDPFPTFVVPQSIRFLRIRVSSCQEQASIFNPQSEIRNPQLDSMTDQPRSTILLLEPGAPRPVAEIARVLIERLAFHPADATSRVRYSGGLLLNAVSRKEAEDVAARLGELGVSTRLVDAALLQDLPRGARARSLEFLSEELCAGLPGGEDLVIPRESIAGIHFFALPEVSRPPEPGAAGPSEGGERSILSPRATRLRENLLAAGGPRIALNLLCGDGIGPVRLTREEIDYSALGSRKAPHSLDNFILILEDLLAFAPEAWLADRLARFVAEMDIAPFLYSKPEEGQNFERWMQIWIRLWEEEKP
jgi:hypothetical protein